MSRWIYIVDVKLETEKESHIKQIKVKLRVLKDTSFKRSRCNSVVRPVHCRTEDETLWHTAQCVRPQMSR